MAFGIDDTLSLATSSISLVDTIVSTVKNYNRDGKDIDLEILLEQVKITALERIDSAQSSLVQFETSIYQQGIDLDTSLSEIIRKTSFWNPVEQYRLRKIRQSFNEFADSIYSATDDVAALSRCHQNTEAMQISVVESAEKKRALQLSVLQAPTLASAISLLSDELTIQKKTLLSI